MKNIVCAITLTVLLASCGGGSGDEKQSKNPSIKMEKSILYIQGKEGGTTETYKEELKFSIENAEGNLYISAKNNNPELIERIYLPSGISKEKTLTLYAAQPYFNGLKKGTYQGLIIMSLCEDNVCVKPIPNSTTTINIVYDVL